MRSPTGSFQKNTFWIFLLVLTLIAMILCELVILRYGAGVASDSTKYLSVAQSLLDGNGLVDHRGLPLLSWPPLYSIVLAALGFLTGLDVFVAGGYLNVFLLGLNIFLSGVIFIRAFSEKPMYAYLATLFVFLSVSSLRIHSGISSDPLYLTLTLGFLVAVHGYITKRSYHAFAWMLLFSVLAPLQRYVGLAVAVTAEVVVLVENRRSIKTFLRDGFVLGLFSVLPIAWWLLVHNIMTYGSLWGTSGERTVDVLKNTELALTKMLHWFVPYISFLMPVLVRPFIILGALALVLYLLDRKNSGIGRSWVKAFTTASIYPSMVHAVIYFAAVALTIITDDHRDLFSDRYYVILLVPTAIFILVTFDTLIMPHLKSRPQQVGYVMAFALALWALYPLYGIKEYIVRARTEGEPSGFNMYNNRTYQEMDLVAEMVNLREIQPNATFYSNYADAVWFYTRRPVSILPLKDVPNPVEFYSGWPFDMPGYIIWFEPNEYKHYLSPPKIADFAAVELIYEGDGGKIYSVQPR
ncbi:MAG TPA: hypothetical protein VNA23_05370 [Anaerolineales bacterium]|nr:hypothetical protein [Anaerolineales bacterium]